MKKFFAFLKTTILGGIFILLPIVLIFLTFAKTYGLLVLVSTSVTDLLFPGHVTKNWISVLIALGLLVLISFIFGLVMLSDIGPRLITFIERTILNKVPGYIAIKNLTTGFANTHDNSTFRPALLKTSDNEKKFIYIVEEVDDSNYAVLVPWSPTPFTGSIHIVLKAQVEILNISMGKLTEVLSQWGVGSRNILAEMPGPNN